MDSYKWTGRTIADVRGIVNMDNDKLIRLFFELDDGRILTFSSETEITVLEIPASKNPRYKDGE